MPDTAIAELPHQLVPDTIVRKEFGGVSFMTLYRWTNDPKLGFPPPVKIRSKNFRSRQALEDFKAKLMRSAINQGQEVGEAIANKSNTKEPQK